MGLRCSSCGYDNDPTRVYCHNCAARIDRGGAASSVPAPTGFTHPTDVAKRKRRGEPLPWGKYFGFLLKLCFLSGLLAVVYLACQPPQDLPAPVKGDENVARRWGNLSAHASDSVAPSAVGFAIPAADLQVWFASLVKVLPPTGTPVLNPTRVYIVPRQGCIRLGLECSLPVDYPLYLEADYAPVRSGSAYSLEPVRYSIGRVPLPVALGYPVQIQFDGLRDALAAPLAQLAKASSIEIAPDKVSLRWDGGATR